MLLSGVMEQSENGSWDPSPNSLSSISSNGHLRKLAIVGSHPNGRETAPLDDPEWEIWLLNEAPQWLGVRWDGCIQMHRPEIYTSPTNFAAQLRQIDYWTWLQQNHGEGKRIFMYPKDERVPNCVEYPLEEVRAMVPYRYLRSSPALALALGIYLGYTTIGLWGSELTSNTEYAYQAPNMTFWIGFAHGRGIDFQLHCWESEFDQLIYGVEGELRIDREFFEKRVAILEPSWRTNELELAKVKDRLKTAMVDNEFIKVSELMVKSDNLARMTGEALGMLEEARRYAGREDYIPRQEFEYNQAKARDDGSPMEGKISHAGGKSEYVWNAWKQTGRIEALNQLRAFTKEQLDLAYSLGRLSGVYKENYMYLSEYDARVTAAGGTRALQAVAEAH